MFGFSIQKLLVLAAIIGAVWYAFKYVGRLQQSRDAEAKAGGGAKRSTLGEQLRDWVGGKPGGDGGSAGATEDLVQCPKCGAYVAAQGAGPCGRDDCPY